jgi:hypothetical protein
MEEEEGNHRLTIVVARSVVCTVVYFSLTSWVRIPIGKWTYVYV